MIIGPGEPRKPADPVKPKRSKKAAKAKKARKRERAEAALAEAPEPTVPAVTRSRVAEPPVPAGPEPETVAPAVSGHAALDPAAPDPATVAPVASGPAVDEPSVRERGGDAAPGPLPEFESRELPAPGTPAARWVPASSGAGTAPDVEPGDEGTMALPPAAALDATPQPPAAAGPAPLAFDGTPGPVGATPAGATRPTAVPASPAPPPAASAAPTAPAAASDRSASPAADGPTTASAVPLVERIDALRERVGALMTALDADRDGSPDAGPTVAGFPSPDADPTVVPSPSPDDDASAADPAAATEAPVPDLPPSAILVARELLAGGLPRDLVAARLRDGYGVADPDAVLTAAA